VIGSCDIVGAISDPDRPSGDVWDSKSGGVAGRSTALSNIGAIRTMTNCEEITRSSKVNAALVIVFALACTLMECRGEPEPRISTVPEQDATKRSFAAIEDSLHQRINGTSDERLADSCYRALLDTYKSHVRYLDDSTLTARQKANTLPVHQTHKKGTITISLLPYSPSPSRTEIVDHFTRCAERYLQFTRSDLNKERALGELLVLYAGRDSVKHKVIATTLLKAHDSVLREQSRKYLAWYAHAEGHFSLAMHYYALLRDSTDNVSDQAEYDLDCADCYFRMGETKRGLELVKQARLLEPRIIEPLRHITEIWWKMYSENLARKDRSYKEFIVFNLQ